ncbi:hypothetical protein SSX86_026426 [Deinandra increscens subsp. villosa]|uniref:RRM domain-containing protein n=1 Tax=Deinandra increscens subsp. villosa TaxID=3103831 RepID=A0AAP0CL36_9ASTR
MGYWGKQDDRSYQIYRGDRLRPKVPSRIVREHGADLGRHADREAKRFQEQDWERYDYYENDDYYEYEEEEEPLSKPYSSRFVNRGFVDRGRYVSYGRRDAAKVRSRLDDDHIRMESRPSKDENDWERVENRKAKYRFSKPNWQPEVREKRMDDRWDDPDKWSSSVFVANLPPAITSKGLIDICSKVGRVVDVYIPTRVSSMGKKYAFVRFTKGSDINGIIQKIRDLWIGNFRLFADVARFKRGDGKPGNLQGDNLANGNGVRGQKDGLGGKKVGNAPISPAPKEKVWKKMTNKPPQADPNESESKIGKNNGETSISRIIPEDCVNLDNFGNSLLIKVRDVALISKVYILAHNEGFKGVEFRYIGGLWVRVDCSSKEECLSFLRCNKFKAVFQVIRKMSSDFRIFEKIVWLEIRGLPLIAWTNAAFKQVAHKWGKCIFFENDVEEALSVGRVGIISSHLEKINEKCMFEVVGNKYEVFVTEMTSWAPTFEHVNVEDDLSGNEEEDEEDDDVGEFVGSYNNDTTKPKEVVASVVSGFVANPTNDPGSIPFTKATLVEEADVAKVTGENFASPVVEAASLEGRDENAKASGDKAGIPSTENLPREGVSGIFKGTDETRGMSGLNAGINGERRRSLSSDPFRLNHIIYGDNDNASKGSSSFSAPPGYTIKGRFSKYGDFGFENATFKRTNCLVAENETVSDARSVDHLQSGSINSNISLMEKMNAYIEYGISMGLDMEGAKSDLNKLISRMSDKVVSQ